MKIIIIIFLNYKITKVMWKLKLKNKKKIVFILLIYYFSLPIIS